MQLLALGLNHDTAPLELREQVAFTPEAVAPALRELTAGETATEAAILSTCNRTEIYCGQRHADPHRVLDWLCQRTGIGKRELAGRVYRFPDEHAVKHAFRVASGLDSMVIGEPQILGQMKHAFHAAAAAGATGKVLNRLFQHTFSVAKQVRTDTAIGAHSVSLAVAGVGLAKHVFASLPAQTALFIGAGETIELAARHLMEAGVGRIVIANRSLYKAETLTRAVGGATSDTTATNPTCQAIPLAQLPAHLPHADIIVTATASTLPILGKGAVERALKARRHKPIFILDLAVPRDVEAEVAHLRDVYLYTVDDLQEVVRHHRTLRAAAAVDAEALIDLQVVRFMRWMRSLQAVPLIRALRQDLDAAAKAEADKAARKIRAGHEPQAVARQLAHDLAQKFAHQPSQALNQASRDGNPQLETAARNLFGLNRER